MAARSWNPFSSCRTVAVAEYDGDRRPMVRRKRKSSTSSSRRVSSTSGPLSPEDLSLTLAQSGSRLQAFTHAELRAATGSFSRRNLLGRGGFGPVYRGAIDDEGVAVKCLDLESGTQGDSEWLAEVLFLGQLRHDNLVKLIGYCYEGEHRMLVYELMAARSLERHLFKRINGSLSWKTRMKIAVGAAKGLAFLHDANTPVIYRDFKASNILLDLDYNAKLSDFGLAKQGPTGDETHVSTRVMGTNGYAAPEYIMTGHLTTKSDVYSFGVVLLELLSGRQSVDCARRQREQYLVDWARPYLKRPNMLYMVMDPTLECQFSCQGAEVAALLAYKCLSEDPESRPTMKEVVQALEPLLGMEDFYHVVPFVFEIIIEEDKVVDVKVDVKEKHPPHRPNHRDRHGHKYPNSPLHAGIVHHNYESLIARCIGAHGRQQRSSRYHPLRTREVN
ncbi:unnamed protein product [Alopecurus aequalis]